MPERTSTFVAVLFLGDDSPSRWIKRWWLAHPKRKLLESLVKLVESDHPEARLLLHRPLHCILGYTNIIHALERLLYCRHHYHR